MAEVVGALASAMTLAGLFKLCLEAFDIIRTFKKQELDLKKLTLRLTIERCRLYNWGKAMGLTELKGQVVSLEDHNCKGIIYETLQMIAQLFSDTQKIESRYGCRQNLAQDDIDESAEDKARQGPIDILVASFSNFSTNGDKKAQVVHKTRWVIHDRKKFGLLMGELKDLIDGLHCITIPLVSIAELESAMKHAIRSIKDVETLAYVTEVTENEYPSLSVAASTKADAASVASPPWQDIPVWAADVGAEKESEADTMEEIESMGVRELKHRLLQMMMNKKTQLLGEQSMTTDGMHQSNDDKRPKLPSQEELGNLCGTQELASPSKIKPILMFHDAHNRCYKLPFELCSKWRSMENMILQAHAGYDAAEIVSQRRYDLLGPCGEVILPHVWDAIIEPGWDVTLKPWPAPEPEPEAPPPLDDIILTLDDILNPKKKFRDPIKLPGEDLIRFTGGSKKKFTKSPLRVS